MLRTPPTQNPSVAEEDNHVGGRLNEQEDEQENEPEDGPEDEMEGLCQNAEGTSEAGEVY